MLRVSFLTALLCFCFTSIVFGTGETSLEKENTRKSEGVIEKEYDRQTKGIIPAYDPDLPPGSAQNVFATKVQDGTIGLSDLSVIASYWTSYLLWLAPSVAVLMLCIGGHQYVFGTLTDDKERGKKTILYASVGLALMYFSWWIVKLVQYWITVGYMG